MTPATPISPARRGVGGPSDVGSRVQKDRIGGLGPSKAGGGGSLRVTDGRTSTLGMLANFFRMSGNVNDRFSRGTPPGGDRLRGRSGLEETAEGCWGRSRSSEECFASGKIFLGECTVFPGDTLRAVGVFSVVFPPIEEVPPSENGKWPEAGKMAEGCWGRFRSADECFACGNFFLGECIVFPGDTSRAVRVTFVVLPLIEEVSPSENGKWPEIGVTGAPSPPPPLGEEVWGRWSVQAAKISPWAPRRMTWPSPEVLQ